MILLSATTNETCPPPSETDMCAEATLNKSRSPIVRSGRQSHVIFSNQSDPTKLLNFASFSYSLRNIQPLYPRGIMYIQSRRKLINALKLDTNPSHTIRAKLRDESTCHWEPRCLGAERDRSIICEAPLWHAKW